MIMKRIGKRGNGRRSSSHKPNPKLPLAFTISSKYIPVSIPLVVRDWHLTLVTELMLSIEVSIAHMYATMQPLQYHDPFPTLTIVCGRLANASLNEMVSLVDREAVDNIMRFLAEWLAAA